MKLFNVSDIPQPVLDTEGASHTIAPGASAELPAIDARNLAESLPERFSLQETKAKPVTKKSSKKEL